MSKKKFTSVLIGIGIFLILSAVILGIFDIIKNSPNTKACQEIIFEMRGLMPEIQNGVPDSKTNISMPMLEIDGMNFIGIIEIPAFNITLPVYSTWNTAKLSKFPCRYMGSVYNNTLIIGGSDNKGQFDFMKIISENDYVFFTDTTGMRYSYRVDNIEISKDASTESLKGEKGDLIFFARNTYSLDYTIVRCALR